jgi:hypothetical protein
MAEIAFLPCKTPRHDGCQVFGVGSGVLGADTIPAPRQSAMQSRVSMEGGTRTVRGILRKDRRIVIRHTTSVVGRVFASYIGLMRAKG